MVLHGIAWYCMVLNGFAWDCMVLHGIAWYCMVLHYLALSCHILHYLALVGTWWYWVRTGRYWLPVLYAFRKYMVYMVKPSIHSIFGERKSDDRQTNGQTDRQNFLSKIQPLLWKESSKNKEDTEGKNHICLLASTCCCPPFGTNLTFSVPNITIHVMLFCKHSRKITTTLI